MIGATVIGSIAKAVAGFLTGGLVDGIVDLGKSYINKEISEAEFRSRVEIALADSATKITESVQGTIRASPALQRAVVFVAVSQGLVLLLYQIGGPLWPMITGEAFPAPVIDIEYAYGLIGLCLTGAYMLRK